MKSSIDAAHNQLKSEQILLRNELKSDVEENQLIPKIFNSDLNVKMVQIGCEIRIRAPSGADDVYYDFVVTYNDLIGTYGVGKYIGLKLKNDYIQMPSELNDLSQYYRLDGVGIAVSADWILRFLYKEAEYKSIVESTTPNEKLKKINEVGANPKPKHNSHNSDLNNLSYKKSILHSSINSFANKTYGMIRHECIAIDVGDLDDNIGDPLKPGTLIEIIPYSPADMCYAYFKIRDFTNWLEKYKMTIYRCSTDDYIVVAGELWPYLMAVKNANERIKFVQNVYRGEFDMSMLKVGQEIRIRGPPDTDVNCYEFLVAYNGIMKEMGIGYYITLQLKNEQVSLSDNLNYLPQWYRSGKKKIIVPVDWIMSNFYKEEKCQTVMPIIPTKNIFPPSLLIQNVPQSTFRTPSLSVEPNNISETGARAEQRYRSSEFVPELITSAKSNSMLTKTQNNFESIQTSSIPNKNINLVSETGTIPKSHRHLAEIRNNNQNLNQTNYVTEIEMINNADGSVRNAEKTICDLCKETVEIGSGVILRECLHSFCFQCIRHHVKQSTNSSTIQCPYIGEYECKSDLWDIEIKDLAGDLDYNRILGNRLNEYMFTERNSRKCVKKDCKKISISSQKSHTNHENCQECNNNTRVNDMKAVNFEKCIMCFTRSDVHLTRCRHPYCQKCIRQWMADQVLDPRKMFINCIQCNQHISDMDISMYGSVEIFSLLKLKITAVTEIQKPLQYITVEDWPVKCVLCEKQMLINTSIILARCSDIFCESCFKLSIDRQLRNSQILECPNCFKCLEKFEVDAIMENTNDKINNIINLVDCILCEKQFEESLTQKCLKCTNIICSKCAYSMLSLQMTHNRTPFCVLCQTLLIDSQITSIKNTILSELCTDQTQLESGVVSETDNCAVCIKKIVKRIELKNCGHGFCSYCIGKNIMAQQAKGYIPNCPICRKPIHSDEIATIREFSSFSSSDPLH